jgi:hypothetical protein
MAAFQTFDLGNALGQAEAIKGARRRNALADLDIEQQKRFNALGPDATPEQYARVGRSDVSNALINTGVSKQEALARLGGVAQQILSIQDPTARRQAAKQAMHTYSDSFSALGVNKRNVMEFDNVTDEQLQQALQGMAAFGPAAKQPALTEVSPGGTLYDPATKRAVFTAPSKPEKSGPQWRYLTPDEIKQRGLPEGTSAQLDTTSGKVDILNKREGLSAAEQKTIREAKMRMPRLNAAVRRVERLGQALESIGQNTMFDGGPMDAKALQYTKQGQEVIAAAAQLMPELQALTRVPGIGSQSDLEARLANLALPSLEMSPEVNARSLAELRAFVEDLRAAYASLVDGGSAQPAQGGGAPASGGWTIQEVK